MPAHRVPPNLKAIAGTERKDRPEPDCLSYDIVTEFPPPPQELNADGAKMWNDLGRQLQRAGVLQVVDLYPLHQLCFAWSQVLKKQRADCEVTPSENNALSMLFSQFGIGPSARRRVLGQMTSNVPGAPANRFASNGRKPTGA